MHTFESILILLGGWCSETKKLPKILALKKLLSGKFGVVVLIK